MRSKIVRAVLASGLMIALVGCSSTPETGRTTTLSASPATLNSTASRSMTSTPGTSSAATKSNEEASVLPLGEQAVTTAGKVTVYAVSYPVHGSAQAQQIATDGFTFAVADIEVCPSTADGFSASRFRIFDSDKRSYSFWNVQIGAKKPNLTDSLYPSTVGMCSRGYLTFEVPPDKRLIAIAYSDSSGSPPIWRISQ